MRSSASPLVRQTVNGLLDLIAATDAPLPSESGLAAQLGVSRSPLRRAMALMRQRGVLRDAQHGTQRARAPRPADRFPAEAKSLSKAEAFTGVFLAKLARGDLRPGQRFSELELAREAGLSTVSIREALLITQEDQF